jgi:hypothetical protein
MGLQVRKPINRQASAARQMATLRKDIVRDLPTISETTRETNDVSLPQDRSNKFATVHKFLYTSLPFGGTQTNHHLALSLTVAQKEVARVSHQAYEPELTFRTSCPALHDDARPTVSEDCADQPLQSDFLHWVAHPFFLPQTGWF